MCENGCKEATQPGKQKEGIGQTAATEVWL